MQIVRDMRRNVPCFVYRRQQISLTEKQYLSAIFARVANIFYARLFPTLEKLHPVVVVVRLQQGKNGKKAMEAIEGKYGRVHRGR